MFENIVTYLLCCVLCSISFCDAKRNDRKRKPSKRPCFGLGETSPCKRTNNPFNDKEFQNTTLWGSTSPDPLHHVARSITINSSPWTKRPASRSPNTGTTTLRKGLGRTSNHGRAFHNILPVLWLQSRWKYKRISNHGTSIHHWKHIFIIPYIYWLPQASSRGETPRGSVSLHTKRRFWRGRFSGKRFGANWLRWLQRTWLWWSSHVDWTGNPYYVARIRGWIRHPTFQEAKTFWRRNYRFGKSTCISPNQPADNVIVLVFSSRVTCF